MNEVIELIKELTNTDSAILAILVMVVGALIVVLGLVGLVISILLAVKYVKYNRKKNLAGLTGKEVARKILDDNGLNKIKVSCVGSVLFGNSYSHFFKKVRLRRFTYKKKSLTSLAMAAQKSALAIMDKEKDPDMKKRNVFIPLIDFGPLAFIPMIVVGILLDYLVTKTFHLGVWTVAFSLFGLLFYAGSFILSVVILKVEMKGQRRAYSILKESNLATSDELEMIQSLFKLYNLEYINNMILAFLELLYRILQIVIALKNGTTPSHNDK